MYRSFPFIRTLALVLLQLELGSSAVMRMSGGELTAGRQAFHRSAAGHATTPSQTGRETLDCVSCTVRIARYGIPGDACEWLAKFCPGCLDEHFNRSSSLPRPNAIPLGPRCTRCTRRAVYAPARRGVNEIGPGVANAERGGRGWFRLSRTGQATATHCRAHRLAGEENVISRRCSATGCGKIAQYRTTRGMVCRNHMVVGEVGRSGGESASLRLARGRVCQHPGGCDRQASYGNATGSRPRHCAAHRLPGDMDVRTPRCGAPGCAKQASCGNPKERVIRFCAEHRGQGDVNLRAPHCNYPEGAANGTTVAASRRCRCMRSRQRERERERACECM